MLKSINAIFGVLEDRIIHLAIDEELQMIKSLIKDISSLREESSKNSSLIAWATCFLGAAFSAFLTALALSGDSPHFYLVYSLIFCTGCMGIYFTWNWFVNRKKERSVIAQKQQQLDQLFAKIEKRIPDPSTSPSTVYEDIVEETLDLREL